MLRAKGNFNFTILGSRTNCSSLNSDLFLKLWLNRPLAPCGIIENAYHFFFICNRYNFHRRDMFHSLSDILNLNLRRLLYGDETLPFQTNERFFLEVQKFIEKVNDFDVFCAQSKLGRVCSCCVSTELLFVLTLTWSIVSEKLFSDSVCKWAIVMSWDVFDI